MRIKINENLFLDKFNSVKEQIEVVQGVASGMATKEMIDKISENEKLIKSNFQMEFERFQQYLKDQNSRFSKQDTKMREIEK